MLQEIKTRPIILPQPVLVVGTYDADGTPDAMTVAWGGQCWTNMVALNISSNHKTTENMRLQGAFTLHIGNVERVELADYFGIVSGHHKEKMSKVHATVTKAKTVNAPIIEEFSVAMECRIVSMTDGNDGSTRVVGEVVRTVADDTVLDEHGHVCMERLKPVVVDLENNEYHSVGAPLGKAYSAGKALE